MSDAATLKSLAKQLGGATSDEEIKGLLGVLKREAKITEATLRESKLGLAVGKLRSHANREVADAAKELVKKWKGEVDREKQARGGSATPATPKTIPAPVRKASVASSAGTPATPRTPTPLATTPSTYARTSLPNTGVRTAKSDGVSIEIYGDKTRDKCIELLYDSLSSDSNAPTDLILKRAQGLEAEVHSNYHGTSAEYKAKIRSLFQNLKDKNNPALRENTVSGDLSVAKLAKMSPQEMASKERKEADKKLQEQNLFESLGAAEQQAETDAFQCGRCKNRKCRYRQAQTRSADEPMTTFVTCNVCGNRWKFS